MMEIEEYFKNEYCVSSDKKRLDVSVIHAYLKRSYWAENIPLEIVQKSIDNSLCFGVYKKEEQVGFARVITDFSTFAYLADVFILEQERGKGLSKFLMECILKHKGLQGLRNFCLMTKDAHALYAKFGFKNIPTPENFMANKVDDIYKKR